MRKEVFTSIVRVKGNSKYKVVSVKSTEPIDISLWKELSKVISRLYASIPIDIGDTICKNILNTGIDIVCTKRIEK
ncbi:DUF1667 domain-containing protein [uncultured Clostridium sp.]|uniref:DUF1667 domain-containing protein n=1 Tax=uncultured Clostridium sp. TaxID=59620 RepID=UPI0026071C21|nr:DUF1667 domain-containing protein [uncultured Clostridium sp.]